MYLTSKFIGLHILSRVQACVKRKTPQLYARNYIRACLTSKFIGVHILSRVITSTRATCKLPKELH